MSSLLQAVREMQKEQDTQVPDVLEVAKFLLSLCTNNGLAAAIAGGYVRDEHYGIEPKDLDIVASYPGGETDEYYFEQLQLASIALSTKYPQLRTDCHEAYGETEEQDKRLSCVLTINGATKPIDLIYYRSTTERSPLCGILDQFDCNLNQFILATASNFTVYLGTIDPRQGLKFLTDDLTQERKDKMTKKWEAIYGKGN